MKIRVEPDKEIPEELREIYAHLAGNLFETYGAFDELMFLFGRTENVDLLNATAPAFFVRHERLLVEGIILSVSRMTDNKESGSGKKPSGEFIAPRLLELPSERYQQVEADLDKKWAAIKIAADPLRAYRHKFLAHADAALHLARSTELDKAITIETMESLLDEISDFLNTFNRCFTNKETTSITLRLCSATRPT